MTSYSADWSGVASRTPPLADTLRGTLPDAAERLFLRAALGGGDRTAAAWNALTHAYPNDRVPLVDGRPELRRLLPVLHFALAEAGVHPAEPALAVMRAATLWEKKRAARIASFLAEIIPAFERSAISPLLLRGFALAGTAYPNTALRHCHDLDFLVTEDELTRASDALAPLDFIIAAEHRDRLSALTLIHTDGFVVSLHTELLAAPLYRLSEAEMVSRAGPAMVAGTSVQVLSRPDMLTHLCAHAAAGNARGRTGWVADAAALLRHAALSDRDCDLLLDMSARSHLALPFFTMLRYLAEEIGAPVSERTLSGLAVRARRSSAAARDAVLDALRRGPEGSARTMFRHSGWRSRLEILRFIVMPSPSYLRSWCAERNLSWTPAWYLARPMRHIAILARNARRRVITAPPQQQHAG